MPHGLDQYLSRGWALLPSFDHDLPDVPVGRPPDGPRSQDATTDEDLLDRWFGLWPRLPVALGLENSKLVVVTVRRDPYERTTDLAGRVLQLPTPQIRHQVGRDEAVYHALLQAPTSFDYADLPLDPLVEVWTEGYLTLPCDCTRPEYDWETDVEAVSPFPDWLAAIVDDVSRREAVGAAVDRAASASEPPSGNEGG